MQPSERRYERLPALQVDNVSLPFGLWQGESSASYGLWIFPLLWFFRMKEQSLHRVGSGTSVALKVDPSELEGLVRIDFYGYQVTLSH